MNGSTAAVFGSGLITMGFCLAAVFFVKFWRQTGDSLFATFAAAS